jgi:hypothetical protein
LNCGQDLHGDPASETFRVGSGISLVFRNLPGRKPPVTFAVTLPLTIRYRKLSTWRYIVSSSAILRAAGTEAIAAKHGASSRWLKRHAIGFAALIADNLKLFALGSAAFSGTTKVLAARITAGLAALRMA